MPSIQQTIQSLDLESPIDLFSLSGSNIPTPFYFCNFAGITFGGITYNAIPCDFEWLAITSEGAVPTSRLIISDVSGMIGALVDAYNIIGAVLTAQRTYRLFLDNAPGADATQVHPPVKLRINKRTWSPGDSIEFECITGFDIERRKLPGRSYLRRCSWYLSDENCRAPTNIHFDLAGNPTIASQRACGKDLASCQRYHGASFGSFFGGFPSAGRK